MESYLLREKLRRILEEDLIFGDITTELLIESKVVEAEVFTRESGILAGIAEALELMDMTGIDVIDSNEDGKPVNEGDVIIRLRGTNRSILMVERSLLNIIARMSGIASATAGFLERAKRANPEIRIAATRKTAPGLRWLDKKAVTIGGGDAHRITLHDLVLVKDNHIDAVGDLATSVSRAKSGSGFIRKIEVEVNTPEDAVIAVRNGADIIMLDNMSAADMEKAVKKLDEGGYRERVLVEASGNVTMDNIEGVAATGVDVISIGSITHSVKALDLALRFVVK